MQKDLSRERPGYRAFRVATAADMIQIVCRNGVVWGLTSDHNIIVRVGITDVEEQGTEWTFLQGSEEILLACFLTSVLCKSCV